MSTRANIVLKDESGDTLWFYRHSDGYPEGTLPTLNKFMEWLNAGKIRDNVGQAGGWLIILGNTEYRNGSENSLDWYGKNDEPGAEAKLSGWKVGAYEPTTGQHGDIEYLYTIDLAKKTLDYREVGFDEADKEPSAWEDDAIQFPRLIAELETVGAFSAPVIKALTEEMAISKQELNELVDRAQTAFDKVKSQIT